MGEPGAAAPDGAKPAPVQPGAGAEDAIKKLDTARDNLRETAKWVVTGTGGIVALIVGAHLGGRACPGGSPPWEVPAFSGSQYSAQPNRRRRRLPADARPCISGG